MIFFKNYWSGTYKFDVCYKVNQRISTFLQKISHIWETKHFLTNADSSTDIKKILLVRKNSTKEKKKEIQIKMRGNFTPFISKSFKIWDHFFPLLFQKDSKNLKSLYIGLREVGAKRRLNGVKKWKKNL